MQNQGLLAKLREHYNQLDWREKAVVEPLFTVNEGKIDEERSSIVEGKDFLKISLESERDVCHPLGVWIGKGKSKHRVYLLFSGEDNERHIDILSYEDIRSDEGLSDVCVTLRDVLRSRIQRQDVLINGELAKRVIKSSAFELNEGELMSFSRTYKRAWCWQRKEFSEADYQPWIEDDALPEGKS